MVFIALGVMGVSEILIEHVRGIPAVANAAEVTSDAEVIRLVPWSRISPIVLLKADVQCTWLFFWTSCPSKVSSRCS
jgi:hypothetical protein